MATQLKFSQRHLVIGAGEIGKSVGAVLGKKLTVFMRDIDGPKFAKIDVLHIAFPYSETFTDQVRNYIEMYDPKLVIVYSTTPIGTCEKISKSVVHSPVEGRHPDLQKSIELGVRWIGVADPAAANQAVALWAPFVKVVRAVTSSAYTEVLKIRSTSKYGVNLVWTDYEKQITDLVGMDFDLIKQFDEDYNNLYYDLGYPEFQRYILDPPNGEIGGHCVTQNAELLDKQFPHPMLKAIKKMRKK